MNRVFASLATLTFLMTNGIAIAESPWSSSLALVGEGGGAGGIQLNPASRAVKTDLCRLPELSATPSRPSWDNSTATTQCGVMESDFGWLWQPMDSTTRQRQVASSVRYGLTPRLDLRLGLTNRIVQSSRTQPKVGGVGDSWFSVRYRVLEQRGVLPSIAVSYGVKVTSASVEKGFGSGQMDHATTLIVSRDLGSTHLDFNLVSTVYGREVGFESASQVGLAVSRPLSRRLTATLESYGGPQPSMPDRYGASLLGASYKLRNTVYVDGAYSRAYTAGSPRSQLTFGITVARRSHLPLLPTNRGWARLLGR